MAWNDVENPLGQICEAWLKKIDLAIEAKEEAFGRYAREAMKFYDGDHAWMWDDDYAKAKGGFLAEGGLLPKFRMTVNRVAELVALFGPSLYARNPSIQVTPLDPPGMPPEVFGIDSMNPMMMDPMAVQQFQMLQQKDGMDTKVRHAHAELEAHYLNWLQLEEDKKVQSRRAITEALIKGLSLMETTMHTPEGSSTKYPVSKFLSVDDFQVDPDACYWEDVQWIAIRCEHPVHLVEIEYNLPRGSLKGNTQSKNSQAVASAKGKGQEKEKNKGKKRDGSYDNLVYWKIYSKSGIGNLLKGLKYEDEEHAEFDFLGKFCFLAVARGVPYPLNVPNEVSVMPKVDPAEQAMLLMEAQAQGMEPPPDPMQAYQETFAQAVEWPIPFWLAKDGWPISRLFFYDKPREIWPMSIIKPAIGLLRFINWGMSFLADKAAAASTTYIGVVKAAAESLRAQIKEGSGPFHLLEIQEVFGLPIDQIVKFLDAPDFGEELYNVLTQVNQSFDKCTGLTELMYGIQGTQARSATEMQIKDQNVSVRPDDMASQVEDWLSRVATYELIAARMMCDGNDMKGPLGETGAWVWESQIMTADVEYIVRSFHVRVEAGSARKPNKANRVQQLNELGQTMMPTLQGFAQMGQVGPYNAYVTDMAKAMDTDATPYLAQPMPPPPPVESSPPPSQ